MDTDIPRLLAARYAHCIEQRCFERMRDILSPDFSQQGPRFTASSLEEFIERLAVLNDYSAIMHLVGQQLGEWHNAIYTGQTWCLASHLYEQEGIIRKLDMGIRYQDVIEDIGGTYLYTSRDLHVIWTQDLPCHS